MLERIRPGWLSWPAILALTLQCIFAGLGIYGVLGNWLGVLRPIPGHDSPSLAFNVAALIWAVSALALVVGIWLDRWWAYLGEFALIWVVLIACAGAAHVPVHQLRLFPVVQSRWQPPGYDEIPFIMERVGVIALSCTLLSRGITGWRRSRSKRS